MLRGPVLPCEIAGAGVCAWFVSQPVRATIEVVTAAPAAPARKVRRVVTSDDAVLASAVVLFLLIGRFSERCGAN